MKEGKDWSQEFQLDCAEWIFNQFGLGQRGCIEIFLDLWEENFFVVLSSGRHRKLHWKIHCLALNGFKLNTVHNLISKEEKSRQSQDLNQGRWVGIKNASFVLPPAPLTSFSLEEEPEKAGNSPKCDITVEIMEWWDLPIGI